MVKKNLFNFFFIVTIFLIDRLSKYFILNSFDNNEKQEIIITSFLSFNLIWNDGIAFGLFSFNEKIYYDFLTGLIIAITIIIFWMIIKSKELEKISFMMIFGGSLGNIFDRIYYRSVPDFIDLHFFNFHWFIFNVADIFITTGVVFLIFFEFFKKKHE